MKYDKRNSTQDGKLMKEIASTQDHIQTKTLLYSLLPLIFSIFSIFVTVDKIKPVFLALPNDKHTENTGLIILKTATPTVVAKAIISPTLTITPTETRKTIDVPLLPERSQLRYSEKVTNIEVLFASHIIANRPKTEDEYRVVLIGDSGTWSNYMPSRHTLAGRLNTANIQACNSKTVKVYNLALRSTSLVKDLVFIEKAVEYKADLVIWLLTLNTFRPEGQLTGKNFVLENRAYIENLSKRYSLGLNTSGLSETTQTTAQAWEIVRAAKEPILEDSYPLPKNDQTTVTAFSKTLPPPQIQTSKMPFNLFYTGLKILSNTDVLVVNEPIFIATGKNSKIRYNEYYPRWIYDQYREVMVKQSQTNKWDYLDLWDTIAAANFTGTPLHRTPEGEYLMFRKMLPIIKEYPCK